MVDFLVGLRYNAEMDEELAVNEFQAYMATERKLFEASETARLKQLQLRFSRPMIGPSLWNNGGLEDARLTLSIGSGTKVVCCNDSSLFRTEIENAQRERGWER